MRHIAVMQARDIIALVDRIVAGDGTIEIEQLMAGLQRLDRTQVSERTPFDYADMQHQSANWPPTGRWPDNPQGKDIQVARRDDL